jgi:hypothetical protein
LSLKTNQEPVPGPIILNLNYCLTLYEVQAIINSTIRERDVGGGTLWNIFTIN